MSVPFLGLRTVIYRVSDVVRATEWYAQVLGFQPYFNEPFYVGFNVGGFELGLQPEEGSGVKAENVEAYWGVDDIASAHGRILALGAKAHHGPQDVGDGIWVAQVKDPWGNLIGLIQNPHFKL